MHLLQTTKFRLTPLYRVRQKSSPLIFFRSFLSIGLDFQGEILCIYVVIILYVHTGINHILIIVHCLKVISIAAMSPIDFSTLKNVRANTQ